jgi:hypothetical protein
MPRREARFVLTPDYCLQRAHEAQQHALELGDAEAVIMLEIARYFRDLASILQQGTKRSPKTDQG